MQVSPCWFSSHQSPLTMPTSSENGLRRVTPPPPRIVSPRDNRCPSRSSCGSAEGGTPLPLAMSVASAMAEACLVDPSRRLKSAVLPTSGETRPACPRAVRSSSRRSELSPRGRVQCARLDGDLLPALLRARLVRQAAAGEQRVPVGAAGRDLGRVAEDGAASDLLEQLRPAENGPCRADAAEQRPGDAVAVDPVRAGQVQALDGRPGERATRSHLVG